MVSCYQHSLKFDGFQAGSFGAKNVYYLPFRFKDGVTANFHLLGASFKIWQTLLVFALCPYLMLQFKKIILSNESIESNE